MPLSHLTEVTLKRGILSNLRFLKMPHRGKFEVTFIKFFSTKPLKNHRLETLLQGGEASWARLEFS